MNFDMLPDWRVPMLPGRIPSRTWWFRRMSSSTDSHIALPRFANRPPVYQKDMRDERISGAKNEIYNHTPYGGYVESIKQKRVVSLCQKCYFVTKIVLNFWEKKMFYDWENLLKFEAEGREFANFLRSLEQFIRISNNETIFDLMLDWNN